MNVKTMPGSVFDTDHRMVKVKLSFLPRSWRFGMSTRPSMPKETRIPGLHIGRLTSETAGLINTKLVVVVRCPFVCTGYTRAMGSTAPKQALSR